MRHTKNREVPAKTETFCWMVTCDLCGNEIKNSLGIVNEVEIECRIGVSDPDGGGSGKAISVDICGQCFTNKLVPWLKSQGAKLRVESWD